MLFTATASEYITANQRRERAALGVARHALGELTSRQASTMVHNPTGQIRELLERSPARWFVEWNRQGGGIENYKPADVIDSNFDRPKRLAVNTHSP